MPIPSTGYVFEQDFLHYDHDVMHPECPERLLAIQRKLCASGLEKRLTKLTPIANPLPHIQRIHTDGHIKGIQALKPVGAIAELAVAGALSAVAAVCQGTVRNAFCALRPPGHHATNTGAEEGFCFYNNVAIAARYAQDTYQRERILIIDWDFHHGNGTEAAFFADPSVLYFSTHHLYSYPGTGAAGKTGKGAGSGYTVNVPLPDGAGDDLFIAAFKNILLPRATVFRPDLVLISAGFDARTGDKLGCFNVTDMGFVELTRMVMGIAHTHCNDRIVSLLEGGYTPKDLAEAVLAHVRTLLEYRVE
jgi:acetoin utilization deacetylase AcuC-like enzyme